MLTAKINGFTRCLKLLQKHKFKNDVKYKKISECAKNENQTP